LHLKHLTLQGFKTFATRTEFAFTPGVTAIVGPNGSGKSNIADAMRWVLGEQSLRPLRIKRTEDVIFAGSSARARQGLAEVSLTLDNSDGRLPLDFSEVTITRRAYRSGESEYRLNNNRVRLRDILELLGKGQIGQSTYTVIGQGMIDEVLSLRPEERRGLFEEAAGIGLYQRKRREAANKLAATGANILRVNDILNELGPRLQRLQRQAQRAQEHAALTSELQELLTLWYGNQWEEDQKALLLAEAQEEEALVRLKAGRKRLASLEQRADGLRHRQLALRESLEDWHRQSSALHAQAETQQRDMAVRAERRAALRRQREAVLAEVPPLVAAREDAERRAGEAESAQARLADERAELETRLAAIEGRWAQRQRRRAALEEELAAAQDAATRCATTLAEARHRLTQTDERRAEWHAEVQEHDRAIAQAEADGTTHRGRATTLATGLEALDQRADSLVSQQAQREAQAAAAATRIEGLTTQVRSLERERHGLTERLQLLTDLRDSYAGYHDGVRFVLQTAAGGRLHGIVGTATDLMTVPSELEAAIEIALGDRLQDLVVETWAGAEQAIGELQHQQAGWVTFLPLDTLRARVAQGAATRLDGVLGRANDLVSYDARHANVFAHLLGQTLVARDLSAARRALTALRRDDTPVQGVNQIVTLAGEVVHLSGAVSGGAGKRRKEGGFLARERELRELPGRIATLDEDLRARQAELDAQRSRRETLLTEAADLSRQAQAIADDRVAQETRIAEERRAAEHLEQEAIWHRARIAQSTAELEALDARETDLRKEVEAAEERQQASNTLVETLRRQLRDLDDEDLTTELAAARTALAVSQEEERSQQTVLEAHRAGIQRLAGQIAAKEEQAGALEAQIATLKTEIAGSETARASLSERLADLSARIEPAEAELRNMESQRDSLVEETSAARRSLLQLETNASRAELEVCRCHEGLEILRRQVDADLGEDALPEDKDAARQLWLRFEGADAGVMLPITPALDVNALEQRISDLRRQIKAAGSVNPDAPAEYEETLARYTFLSTQAEDLREASKSLRAIIAELDEVMQREFDQTFKTVAQEFRRYFTLLFGGGTARLSLVDAEDPREAGVEIVARPPGKREQGLALLSGGERALTAVALLFAILTVNPTPFCMLDEVDATLDEPNARRFREALQGLVERTQFIIITHNRVTMEAANTLYGVSMGEDSVSRVLSLKMDEVTDEALGAAG
jgi:chromosome segregation protein